MSASYDWMKESYTPGANDGRLDIANSVLLLVDHQTGLNQLVRDFEVERFKNNVLFLADTAKKANIPVILTTSFEDGPNGPLWIELQNMFKDESGKYTCPYFPRPGNINAWDMPAFREAVIATGRKQLIIAGIVTEVCVAFPALSARREGYQVFAVVDASGTFSEAVRAAAHTRMVGAGCTLTSCFAVSCELFRDWRNQGHLLASLCNTYLPAYSSVSTSFAAAQTKKN